MDEQHTIHGKEKPPFRSHTLGQLVRVVGHRVEREGAHAWGEFGAIYSVRNSDRTLERDVQLLMVCPLDTDNILGFALRGALFERAVERFCPLRLRVRRS